ncbi:hypothetical protein Tco_1004811 [Tanacetum coccineum]|uniref:Uncharacterized protein n=1 Tax=Tanacetum coccineum TaxID=301880 RepID=A0ABQ5FEE5_9ASTR
MPTQIDNPLPSTSSLTLPSQPPAQSSNDAILATMNQIVNLLSGFQKQFPPTNNQLRTLSNPKNHATVHDGYALTHNPTIYDSLVKQFWQTTSVITLSDGSQEIKETIDSNAYTITEASIRNKLQLADALGIHMLPNDDILEGMRNIGSKSGGWDQFGSNIAVDLICLSTGRFLISLKDEGAGQEAQGVVQSIPSIEHVILSVTQPQPSPDVPTPPPASPLPIPTSPPTSQPILSIPTQIPPLPSTTALHTPTPSFKPEPEPEMEHTFDQPSPQPSPTQHAEEPPFQASLHAVGHLLVTDLFQLKVKLLEKALKRKTKKVILLDSKEEELESQGRKINEDDPLTSLVEELLTPSKDTGKDSGEAPKDISPTTLEAAQILSKVASQKSVDKGKRYTRKKVKSVSQEVKSGEVEVNTSFDAEVSSGDINIGGQGINTGSINFSTASVIVSSGLETVSTESTRVFIPKEQITHREGKAPMIIEDAPKKTKEQILQEEAGMAEELELTDEQKKRKAQVQFEAQFYSQEDWNTIRAKLEANAELTKSVVGGDLQGEDFAKKMNQGTWKISQLKNLTFKELKVEFDKLVRQVESFEPTNFEATKAELKRFGEELQTKTAKRQKVDKEEKEIDEAVNVEQAKKSTGRKKQIARKGLYSKKKSEDESEEKEPGKKAETTTSTNVPINHVPIVRENGTDVVYISFGAMLNAISRDDLTKLYRIVMKKYGMEGPEDELERVLWSYLKNMFDTPLNIYMLSEKTYPLSADVCRIMLNKKLQDGKQNEFCYQLLKLMENNVGNTGNRGTQSYGQMTDNKGKKVICYNCYGEGHVARTVLKAEAKAFLADVECTAPYDQPLAITTTNLFEVNGANTSHVNEVHTSDNHLLDNVNHLMLQEMHQEDQLDSDVDSDIDDNTIRVHDSEDTLVQAEVSRAKMSNRPGIIKTINYAKLNALFSQFFPQKELSYLAKEVIEFMRIFDELDKEYEQCILEKKNLQIEKKNLLIQNECIITDSIAKDIFYIVLSSDRDRPLGDELCSNYVRNNSKVIELEAEISKQQQMLAESDKQFRTQNDRFKVTALTTENAKLKTELISRINSEPKASEKPKVLASGMYANSPKYIPPQRRINRTIPTLLTKEKESAVVKPHNVSASSKSMNSSKNMPRFSSNDMVHKHYLEEAKKKTQEIGRIFKTVGLRWVPTGKIFDSCISKVNSQPTNGSNDDITNQYACEQTLDVSAGLVPNSMTSSQLSSGLAPNLMTSDQPNLGLVPNSMTSAQISSGLVPNSSMSVQPSLGLAPNSMTSDQHSSGLAPNSMTYVQNSSGLIPNSVTFVQSSTGLKPNITAPVHNGVGPKISALQSGRTRSELVNDSTTPSVHPFMKQLEELFQPLFDDDEEFPPVV